MRPHAPALLLPLLLGAVALCESCGTPSGVADGGVDTGVDTSAPDVTSDGAPDAPDASHLCAVEVSAGDAHTCARKADGTVWCWGRNNDGQLGDGTTKDALTPVAVATLGGSNTGISAGLEHTCAVKADGTAWCWGLNNGGQLGDGTTQPRSSPVQVNGLTAVTQISSGGGSTCARQSDGTLWCWGGNSNGQLGDGTTQAKSSPVQVTALGTNVVQVSAGGTFTCAVKTDASLWCWGENLYGALGNGIKGSQTTPQPVAAAIGTSAAQVSAGTYHACARQTDGTLWCWGANDNGQLGDGQSGPGTEWFTPVQLTTLADVAEVSADDAHTCARKTDGSLWCWGSNAYGQLGDGTTQDQTLPIQVTAMGTSVAAVSTAGIGEGQTCVRKTDDSLWCWGNDGYGQLGNGLAFWSVPVPAQVLGDCP